MSELSKRDLIRGLLAALDDQGLLEYGSVIETSFVHEILDITMPQYAAKEVFERLAVYELAAIDYVRSVLLGQGKYISGTPSGYRVLLPSENKGQIDNYMSSADRKLSRALKLSRNTPKSDSDAHDQTEVRIHMKRTGIRSGFEASIQ